MRGGDAAGLADRPRPRRSQPAQHRDDRRAGGRARDSRRGHGTASDAAQAMEIGCDAVVLAGAVTPGRRSDDDGRAMASLNRFKLTEYGVVIVSRRGVVHLNVAGRFTFVCRATRLHARLLRLVRLRRVRRCRGGYWRSGDRRRDGCGAEQRCNVLESDSHNHHH